VQTKGTPVRVMCVAGSPAARSGSRQLLLAVAEELVRRGCDIDLVDLRDLALPAVDVTSYLSMEPYPVPAGEELRRRVAQAATVVLATPVHHASFSGVLKNALDFLLPDALAGKAVGLLASADSPLGGGTACEHLRTVVRAMSGWAAPTQIISIPADFQDPSTRITSQLSGRIDALCDELMTFAQAMLTLSDRTGRISIDG
jgi:NAD(P)H-dependent FMN reductase